MALTDNLISYWKFDEASGNAADANSSNTLTNNGTTPYAAGKINNAGSYNGTSQYFSSNAAALFPTGSQSYQFWVNPNAASGSRYLLWNTFSGSNGLITGLENSTGLKIRVAIYNSGGSPANKDYTSTITVSDSIFTHIILVFTAASGQWDFYVNGVNQHTESSFPTSIDAQANAFLGIDANLGAGNFFKGLIDEVGIWSRVLTSGEVTSLYNGGAGLAYPFGAVGTTLAARRALQGVGI